MEKPIYLLPFIFVYRAVTFLVKIPLMLIKYFSIGFFAVFYGLIALIVAAILNVIVYSWIGFYYISYLLYQIVKFIGKYLLKGLLFTSFAIYKLIKYAVFGFFFPIVLLFDFIVNALNLAQKRIEKQQKINELREKAKLANKEIELENKRRLEELRREEKLKKDHKPKTEVYVNENVEFKRKTFADKLNDFFASIGKIPSKIKQGIVNKYKGSTFVKQANTKKELNRQALLLDYDGDDAKKSIKKIVYKYEAKRPDGKVVIDYFPAFSRLEVHSHLLSEGYEVYSIITNKWIQALHAQTSGNSTKIKTSDLIFFTTQLSTYIKAGIPLVDSLKILSRQFKKKSYQRILNSMIYELSMGDSFSDAMSKQGVAFPRLLINMIKAAEMTGELPEALDDMAEYFTETDKTRKQMVTAMMYPAIILVIAIGAIAFIMIYVVPKFISIYENFDGAEIPAITIFVLNVSIFLKNQYMWLILGIAVFVLMFVYLYKNVKSFKTAIQTIIMHLPIFGNVVIYNEVTMFTKTFASLLSHNVFITDSMDVLNKITNNEIYKQLINSTINNLAHGDKISLAFQNEWSFPIPAYEMIVTGEMTGQLPEMMSKVSAYYQELHRQSVSRIKTFIEPALIIFLTVAVGGIVLSIVIPMFSIYNNVQM